MHGECTRLDEVVSNPVSSDARLAPGLVGQGWYGILRNFFLNLSTIFANTVLSLRQM